MKQPTSPSGAEAQTSSPPSTTGHDVTPAPAGSEIVTRPEPGLARGAWEAPVWAFWVILALVLVAAGAYLLHRLGRLKVRKSSSAERDAVPPSTKVKRP